jgi:tRNA (adenine37-N6)-methyltransferase
VDLALRPIGVVRSPYATPLDAPRQGEFAHVESVIEIHPGFEEGLAGVESLERVLVVWWAHQADRDLLRRPGTDGVFAMRTPHRPNPICLSEVRLLRREG